MLYYIQAETTDKVLSYYREDWHRLFTNKTLIGIVLFYKVLVYIIMIVLLRV